MNDQSPKPAKRVAKDRAGRPRDPREVKRPSSSGAQRLRSSVGAKDTGVMGARVVLPVAQRCVTVTVVSRAIPSAVDALRQACERFACTLREVWGEDGAQMTVGNASADGLAYGLVWRVTALVGAPDARPGERQADAQSIDTLREVLLTRFRRKIGGRWVVAPVVLSVVAAPDLAKQRSGDTEEDRGWDAPRARAPSLPDDVGLCLTKEERDLAAAVEAANRKGASTVGCTNPVVRTTEDDDLARERTARQVADAIESAVPLSPERAAELASMAPSVVEGAAPLPSGKGMGIARPATVLAAHVFLSHVFTSHSLTVSHRYAD